MNKKIIIPLIIIAFVTGAYFYTQNKKTANKKAWLKDWINQGGDTEASEQSFNQILEIMSSKEIDVIFNVLNTYSNVNNAPLALKTEFNAISEKYNIFS